MDRIRFLFRKALTPITIMVIPHENLKPLNLKVPFAGILLTLLVLTLGVIQTYRLVVNGLKYPFLMGRVDFYTQRFSEWNSNSPIKIFHSKILNESRFFENPFDFTNYCYTILWHRHCFTF